MIRGVESEHGTAETENVISQVVASAKSEKNRDEKHSEWSSTRCQHFSLDSNISVATLPGFNHFNEYDRDGHSDSVQDNPR